MTDAPPPGPHRLTAAWLTAPDILDVAGVLARGGASPRYVGGCVRDALLGRQSADIDIAVLSPPLETMRLLEEAGLKVAPTGVEHGTVTAVTRADLAPTGRSRPLEITTLRRDVATDGRRAVVAFSTDWAEDAARRDFTMNALYADADPEAAPEAQGAVYDPLGEGLADLARRRVRFIGHAEDRIREDYLRILRFFRFCAWYGANGDPAESDPDGLAACAAQRRGLGGLARERVGRETLRLLSAPDPAAALRRMAETGVLAMSVAGAGLPPLSAALLGPLIAAETEAAGAPNAPGALTPRRWQPRLAALLAGPGSAPEALAATLTAAPLRGALRLSNTEDKSVAAIAEALTLPPAAGAWRGGLAAAEDAALLRRALGGPTPAQAEAADRARGASAAFPLSAKALMAAGWSPGPGLGAALKHAEAAWLSGDLTADGDALLRDLGPPRR